MLATRLWMGTILVVLVVGMLVVDQHLAPFYPFQFFFFLGISLSASIEMILLLGPGRRPQTIIAVLSVLGLAVMNWIAHYPPLEALAGSPGNVILGSVTVVGLVVLLWEMALFTEASRSLERMGITVLIVLYLGLFPCFLAQVRWLYPEDSVSGSVALALMIFVPKGCDIGAYAVGRILGRTPMTPVLSPKKTWEGAIGGFAFAAALAVAIDRLGPVAVLDGNLILEIAFGLVVGMTGMVGDLAESLIKRDCRHKDASHIIPGFGGVLDVIDAVYFSAPVAYFFLRAARGI